jgi:hypothetical protein
MSYKREDGEERGENDMDCDVADPRVNGDQDRRANTDQRMRGYGASPCLWTFRNET